MSPIIDALIIAVVALCGLILVLVLHFTDRLQQHDKWIADHDDAYLRRERGLQVRREGVRRDLDEAKRIASAVTLAASDVLAKLSEFMEENKFDPSSPYFDEEAYESAVIDAYKNPMSPEAIRECCEGRKPGCPDWLFIGDACEKLWGIEPPDERKENESN